VPACLERGAGATEGGGAGPVGGGNVLEGRVGSLCSSGERRWLGIVERGRGV